MGLQFGAWAGKTPAFTPLLKRSSHFRQLLRLQLPELPPLRLPVPLPLQLPVPPPLQLPVLPPLQLLRSISATGFIKTA